MNKRTKIFIVIALLFTLYSKATNAQDISAHIDIPVSKFAAIDSLLDNRFIFECDITKLNNSELEKSFEQSIDQWKEASKRAYKSRTGIDFLATYDHRFGDLIADDFSDMLMSYSNRLQTSIHWNILESGFIGAKNKDQEVELIAERFILMNVQDQIQLDLDSVLYHQTEILNAFYNCVIQARIDVNNIIADMLSSLSNEDKVLNISIADTKYQLALLRGQKRSTSRDIKQLLDIDRYIAQQDELSFSNIDSLVLLNTKIKEWDIERRLLINKANSINYWHSVKLAPFARIQYYDRAANVGNNQLAANVGLSLSLPLSFEIKNKKIEAQRKTSLHINQLDIIKRKLRYDYNNLYQLIDKNLITLNGTYEAYHYYRIKAKEVRNLYQLKRKTILDVCIEYDKLLKSQAVMCDLVLERETLLIKLLALMADENIKIGGRK